VEGPGKVSAKWLLLRFAPCGVVFNPTLRANIGIEIKIMTTGTSIEAHTTPPAVKTALR